VGGDGGGQSGQARRARQRERRGGGMSAGAVRAGADYTLD